MDRNKLTELHPFQNVDLLRSIVDNTSEAILVLDQKLTVTAGNAAAEKLFLLNQRPDRPALNDMVVWDSNPITTDLFSTTNESRQVTCLLPNDTSFVAEAIFLQTNSDWYIAMVRFVAQQERESKERLEREATTDSLTGLLNRRQFQSQLEESLKGTIALAIVDVDHFKNVNDSLGHVVGDDILKVIAIASETFFADGSFIARLGGDELGVIFENIEADELQQRFTLLQEQLQEITTSSIGQSVTVSIGIAYSLDGTTTAREILTAADHAMYESKQAGRNKLTIRRLEDS